MSRSIVVEGLTRRYGDFVAVDGISFRVEGGEIFGFLGPNGAGKSTTIKILTTLLLPSSGRVEVAGHDVVGEAGAVRMKAGVALQEIGVDPLLTGRELLEVQARLFGIPVRRARRRAEELLSLVGLEDAAGRRTGSYSGGMRRKLDLALALVHAPSILFLDEPTTGLDPASRRDIWKEVKRLNEEDGVTVLLSTQYLEEADQLADRLAIIDHGKIVAEGTPRQLKERVGGQAVSLEFGGEGETGRAAEALQRFGEVRREEGRLTLYLPEAASTVPEIVRALDGAGCPPARLNISEPSLDDVFLQVTGTRLTSGEDAKDARTIQKERNER